MNRYGQMLERQWTSADPRFVESLEDPQEHFTRLGQEVQDQIDEILPSLEGTDPAGETYLEKVGRLNAARMQAEEIVLAQHQPPSSSPEPDEPEDWDEMTYDQQESWTLENLPPGEEREDQLRRIARGRNQQQTMLGASTDLDAHQQQD